MTPFGVFHTALSLLALLAGVVALFRDKALGLRSRVGQAYVALTALTAFTGLFIFHHGGFGAPHVLSILTLVVIEAIILATATNWFGRHSRAIEVVAGSATFFFSLIPGVTETTTRLPVGAPLFEGPNAPQLLAINGVLFVLFLIGATAQVLSLPKPERKFRLMHG